MEFALVLPVLLLIILGGTFLLQWIMTINDVQQALNVGIHQAAIVADPDDPGVPTLITSVMNNGFASSSCTPTTTITCGSDPCQRYDLVDVTIRAQCDGWVGGSFTVERSATRAAERDEQ